MRPDTSDSTWVSTACGRLASTCLMSTNGAMCSICSDRCSSVVCRRTCCTADDRTASRRRTSVASSVVWRRWPSTDTCTTRPHLYRRLPSPDVEVCYLFCPAENVPEPFSAGAPLQTHCGSLRRSQTPKRLTPIWGGVIPSHSSPLRRL